MPKHLFILNQTAGISEDKIRAVCERLGLDFAIETTPHAGLTEGLVHNAAQGCKDLRVYACGGDGTLNNVLNAVVAYMKTGAPNAPAVTHIPCGTGNDFIRCFGSKSGFLNMEALVYGHETELDLIEITYGAAEPLYAVNICSAGVDADVAAGVTRYKRMRRFGSKMPYNLSLAATFLKGVRRSYAVTLDGVREDGNFTILTCCNGQTYGGGFHACPDANPSDGQLEFLLVKGVSRSTLIRIVGTYAKGGYKKLSRYITHKTGRALIIETQEPVNINYDGEILRSTRVEFALSPLKLRFIVP